MKKVCGTCNFNIDTRAGSASVENNCAYDNKWRKSDDTCPNWSERSNSLSTKDRIDMASSNRQDDLTRETISIAREANSIARDARSDARSANKIAIIAMILSAATAIIVAIIEVLSK